MIESLFNKEFSLFCISLSLISADPKFSAPISNVTFPVGREALLTCVVQDLGSYKVSINTILSQTVSVSI